MNFLVSFSFTLLIGLIVVYFMARTQRGRDILLRIEDAFGDVIETFGTLIVVIANIFLALCLWVLMIFISNLPIIIIVLVLIWIFS